MAVTATFLPISGTLTVFETAPQQGEGRRRRRRQTKRGEMNSHPAVRTDFYASPVGRPADAASPMQRVARWLRQLWRAYWRYKAHRAAVVILPSLDDRTLRDIGLTRHDVHTAMFGTAADRVHLLSSG
jgi:uncharacterized protein YjiS (DUF1127 family)